MGLERDEAHAHKTGYNIVSAPCALILLFFVYTSLPGHGGSTREWQWGDFITGWDQRRQSETRISARWVISFSRSLHWANASAEIHTCCTQPPIGACVWLINAAACALPRVKIELNLFKASCSDHFLRETPTMYYRNRQPGTRQFGAWLVFREA